jgi:hypothetical protein
MQPFKYIAGTDEYNKMLPSVTLQASLCSYEVCQLYCVVLAEYSICVYTHTSMNICI